MAGTGPTPMTRGATPALAAPLTRASGSSPYRSTAASEASSRAAAPSLMPDALPAVTLPPARKAGLSAASDSAVVLARGCSSVSTTVTAPRRPGTSTGTISPANQPSAWAVAVRCWERRANASWSARETPWSSATFSAVSPIASVP